MELHATAEPSGVHVEVSDPGPGFDKDAARREPSLTGEGGYGLNIIDKVAHRWGVKRNRFARVWFEIDREPRPESHAGARRREKAGPGGRFPEMLPG